MFENRKVMIIVAGSIIAFLLMCIIFVSYLITSKKTQIAPPSNSQQIIPLTPTPQDILNGEGKIADIPPPDPAEIEKENIFYRENRPDIFMTNLLPIQNNDFTIESDLEDDGIVRFTITSTTGSIATAQSSFVQWAQGIGLTNEQINGLRITYK